MIRYETNFTLLEPVIDFDAATAYLAEDRMLDYFDDKSIAKKLESIDWVLSDEQSGKIIVLANEALSEDECAIISRWISGQNSDGLGEGFEQQDFAEYDENRFDEYGNKVNIWDLDDDYEENWVMASFDWQTNAYPLHFVESF